MEEEVARQLSPKVAQGVLRSVDRVAQTNVVREATRSELTRTVDLIRAFFLRAGELTGLGDGVFFLTVDQVITILSGDMSPAACILGQREAYEQYSALPTLPSWIRGHFDPVQWAADPNRRRDLFDPATPLSQLVPEPDAVIKGQPGSAGRVEGIVRQVHSPEEGDQLLAGEILVASTTNVGWTPLFPRAAAVVTDVGGSLSHAAIVARELGIPAVVGCGDATLRLHSGDRVRVDGGKGTVEPLVNNR